MRLRRFVQHESVPDNRVDEHQYYQDPDTIDEPDLFSTHTPASTPSQDQQSEEELDHETQNTQKNVIQLQPAAGMPPSLIDPEITMPRPYTAPFENPLSLQEYEAVATSHDDVTSPEVDSQHLERETHTVSLNPINVTPQPASPPPTGKSNHAAPEQVLARTHTTRYNLLEIPQHRIYQDYFIMEQSNKPALAKILLGKNH